MNGEEKEDKKKMYEGDESRFANYNYGDAEYWDERYMEDGSGSSFDWYQRYSALRPYLRKYIPTSSRVLMVGCGNAVISEDMVKDGYEDITNIDISSVAIDMMKKKYAHVTRLKYMQMDVRDMSYFLDESFDNVIDKGTFDSLMCGINARISVSSMLNEVSRLLRPGGLYILITYGDPTVRISHFKSGRGWKILLYILPRPGFQTNSSCSPYLRSLMEPVHLSERGMLPSDFVLDDPESHYIYVCQKIQGLLSSEDEETPTT